MKGGLLAFLSLISVSLAAPLTTDPGLLTPEYFAVADKNKDGKIDFDEFLYTNQEYINAMMKQFATMDTDGSDSLDVKEFTTHSKMDKNRYSIDLVKDSNEDEPIIILRPTGNDALSKPQRSDKSEKSDESYDSDDVIIEISDEFDEDSDSDEELYSVTASNRAVMVIADDVFQIYDDDSNGLLNEDELMTYIQDYLEMALKRSSHVIVGKYDENKDGGLDKTELGKFTSELPSDLVEELAGSEEYDYVHDSDDNDYGFAADSIVSDHH